MLLLTHIFAVVGVLSAFVTVFVFFSGRSDFGSLARELAVRFGVRFAARPATYYDTRMVLTAADDEIVATFQLPVSVEATFRIATGSRKGLLGPSSDPSYGLGFQNAQGTLFGFTSQPATKTGYTYIFFRDSRGQISLIDSVNEKIAAMLPEAWRNFALGFLRIEGILRRSIEFETVDFSRSPRQTLHFIVHVDSRGNLIYKNDLLLSPT